MSVVAAAVVGSAAVGLYSSRKQSQAAARAGDQQAAAAYAGIEAQQEQFDQINAMLQPYRLIGRRGLDGQRDILGINGDAAQQREYRDIENSPAFGALMDQGENAMRQNASATGGLRGGNFQGALAQFRPQMLAQLIEQQYGRYADLTSTGLNAATQTGGFGQRSAMGTADLLQQAGAARAGSSLAAGQAYGGYANAITGAIGLYGGLGGFGTPAYPGGGAGVVSGGSGIKF